MTTDEKPVPGLPDPQAGASCVVGLVSEDAAIDIPKRVPRRPLPDLHSQGTDHSP